MTVADRLSEVAAAAGVGALAGLAGTAAMTISSTAEAKLRGRGSSDTPARAAGALLGVKPTGEDGQQRFNNIVHWAYGTGWGTVRGLLDIAGLHGPAAAAAHLGAVWAGEQVVLPSTGASSPAWKWGAKEIGIDLLHHTVYAAATSAVYEWLDPTSTTATGTKSERRALRDGCAGFASGRRVQPERIGVPPRVSWSRGIRGRERPRWMVRRLG